MYNAKEPLKGPIPTKWPHAGSKTHLWCKVNTKVRFWNAKLIRSLFNAAIPAEIFQCLVHFCSTAVSVGFGPSHAENLLLEILILWLTAGTRPKPRMVKERQAEGCLLNDQHLNSNAWHFIFRLVCWPLISGADYSCNQLWSWYGTKPLRLVAPTQLARHWLLLSSLYRWGKTVKEKERSPSRPYWNPWAPFSSL